MKNNSLDELNHDSDFANFINTTLVYAKELLKNFIWIIIPAALFAGFNLYKAIQKGKFYQCSLTFVLDEENASVSMDIAGLSSMYGLGDLSENGTSSDRIMRLFQSNSMLAVQLLKKDSLNETSLANRVLEHYNSDRFFSPLSIMDHWTGEEVLKLNALDDKFRFSKTRMDDLDLIESAILENITEFLTLKKEPVTRIEYDEDARIFTLLTRSLNQKLSIDLTNSLFQALSKYYTLNRTKKQNEIYHLNKSKTDSLKTELASAQYKLANFVDSNRNLVFAKGRLTKKKIETEIEILRVLYSEARKQLQISEYALRQVKPIFQVIDYPSRSLKALRHSKKRAVLFGGLLGAFLGMGLIVLRKAYSMAMPKQS